MGELKPIGSEKLNADEKLKRILNLTYYQSTSGSKKSSVIVEQTSTGVYGIVKEKDGYYVKKGLNEDSLDYIGGLFMKNKNRFSSYAEALKKLEFLTEQEHVQEATKYVLKTKTPKAEAPIPEPTNELPPPEAAPEAAPEDAMPDMGGDVPTDELSGDETSEPGAEEDYLKVIQKLTGKLGEKLRSFEDKLESDDIKYVLNMVISAVDLDKLEETDKEEILDKFDPEEETSDETLPSDEVTGDETPAPAPAEDDLGEEEGMKKLEELIGTSFFDDEVSGNFEDDDEIDDFQFEPEDPKASKFAKKDMEDEFPDDVESLENGDEDVFDNIWKNMKSNKGAEEDEVEEELSAPVNNEEIPIEDEIPIPDEELGATAPIPDEEEEKTVELDIDELTNMVNTSVKETLSKYFNQ